MFKSVFGGFGATIQSPQEVPINSQAPSENIQSKFTCSFGKFNVDFLVRGPGQPQRNDTRKYLQPLDEKEATSICEILKNEPVSSVHIKVAFRIYFPE